MRLKMQWTWSSTPRLYQPHVTSEKLWEFVKTENINGFQKGLEIVMVKAIYL